MRLSQLTVVLVALGCSSESGGPTDSAIERQEGGGGGGASSMGGRVLGIGVGSQSAAPVANASVQVIRLGDMPQGQFAPQNYQSGPDAVPECAVRGTRVAEAITSAGGEFQIGPVPGGLHALRAVAPQGSSFSVPAAICYFPVVGDSAFQGIELRVREPGAPLPGSGGPGTHPDTT